jgi:hypothetical protein
MAPTPTGQPTLPSEATGTAYTASYFEQLFAAKWGAAAGNAYLSYNSAHPERTPYQNAQAFLALVTLEGLDNAIQAGVTAGANIGVGTAQGAAQGASNAYKALSPVAAIGDFLSRLTSPHTWLRVAEVLVGVMFLAIGLNHLLGNPAGKVAKAMPKVVPV